MKKYIFDFLNRVYSSTNEYYYLNEYLTKYIFDFLNHVNGRHSSLTLSKSWLR